MYVNKRSQIEFMYERTEDRSVTYRQMYTHTQHTVAHKKIYSQFGWLNLRDFVFDFLLIRHFWVFNRIPENGDKVVFIIELRNDNHSAR